MRALSTRLSALLVASASALALSFSSRDASACGGCFVGQEVNTQVSGHRMILSLSNTQTTLWDQITYVGAPESFAWVLPIKGVVEVGLSSDYLFQSLEEYTAVTVTAYYSCPTPSTCNGGSTGSGLGGGGYGRDGVDILAHEVVGPYETVQLSSQDPGALENWLTDHGYVVPADIAPTIDAYVNEGFDFLALKLVPGVNVDAMRPVRITSPGASPVLPLRMVGAGTGAITPITLWVMSEGRYEPSNMPWFTIDPSFVTFDFGTGTSNYKTLRQEGYAATSNEGWLIEMAEELPAYDFYGQVWGQARYVPTKSGYGDGMGTGAVEECEADLAALLGPLERSTVVVTRMAAELSRPALVVDLGLAAAADQSTISHLIEANHVFGAPDCPPVSPPNCGGDGAGSGEWSSSSGDEPGGAGGDDTDEPSGGCAVGASGPLGGAFGALALSLGLALARRRRKA